MCKGHVTEDGDLTLDVDGATDDAVVGKGDIDGVSYHALYRVRNVKKGRETKKGEKRMVEGEYTEVATFKYVRWCRISGGWRKED